MRNDVAPTLAKMAAIIKAAQEGRDLEIQVDKVGRYRLVCSDYPRKSRSSFLRKTFRPDFYKHNYRVYKGKKIL